jgi:hypothetical protein
MMLLILALIPLALYALGLLPYRLLWPAPGRLAGIIVPQVFGLIIAPAIFALVYLLAGWDAALFALPLASLILLAASRRVPGKRSDEKLSRGLMALVAIFVLLSAISMIPRSTPVRTADTTFYLTATQSILDSKHLPPDTLCLPGHPYNYSWFWNVLLAATSVYSQTVPIDLVMLMTPYLAFLFIGAAYLASRAWFDHRPAMAATAILSAYFFGSYTYPTTPSYALPVLALFFASFLLLVRNPDSRRALTAGLLAASLIYVHGLSFAFAAVLLMVQATWFALRGGRNLLLPMLAPLLLTLPYVLTSSGGIATGFLFLPFASLTFNYIGNFSLLLPLAAIGVWLALRGRKVDDMQLSLALLVPLLLANLFVMRYSPNIERFIIYSLFPLTVIGLQSLVTRKWLLYGLTVLLVLQFSYVGATNIMDHYRAPAWDATPEGQAALWLRANAEPGSGLVAAPTPIYSGISGLPSIICEPDFLRGWFYDMPVVRSSFEDLLLLYKQPSQDIIASHNATYFIVGDRERAFFSGYGITPYDFSDSSSFRAVYTTGNTTIYKLANPITLPPISLPRGDLNYTSYSRWWEN